MISKACVAIQDLETSIMQNMLKEACGTGLHVLNWGKGQNSLITAHISSRSQENEEGDKGLVLSWH